jgi:hypothetical protein
MMNRASYFVVIALSIFFSVLMTTLPAMAQELEIRITYDEERDRILPVPKLIVAHKVVNIVITGSGAINASHEDVVGKNYLRNEKELRLGPSGGEDRWRVVSKDKLMNVQDFISFRRAILVSIVDTACTAQIDYELKPGFSDYQYTAYLPGGAVVGQGVAVGTSVARSLSATDMTCTISQTKDAH